MITLIVSTPDIINTGDFCYATCGAPRFVPIQREGISSRIVSNPMKEAHNKYATPTAPPSRAMTSLV